MNLATKSQIERLPTPDPTLLEVSIGDPVPILGPSLPHVSSIRRKLHEKSLQIARSITAWGSPTTAEEVFAWGYLARCERVLDVGVALVPSSPSGQWE